MSLSVTAVLMMVTCAFLNDVTYVSGLVNLTTSSGKPEVMLNGINSTRLLGLLETVGNRQVAAFLGIPYAEAPVGHLRFQRPILLYNPHQREFSATKYGPACFSAKPTKFQSEDCLFINVWVPLNTQRQRNLPVIVWMHGGGFVSGSGADNPGDRLAAENDVIVVSMNYRLGPLGFLSTGDTASQGNYGLWDQHTALKWVKFNIEDFGGDPAAVTIMGESAGAKSVSFHVISPHSYDLFDKAIMQSGSVFCPTSVMWKPVESAKRLANALGCYNPNELVDCLRLRQALDIASQSSRIWREDPIRNLIDSTWAPVEDGDFVPRLYDANGMPQPFTHSTAGVFKGKIMVGVNNNEGAALKLWRIPAVEKIKTDIESELLDPNYFREYFMQGVMQQMFRSKHAYSTLFRTVADFVTYKYTDWSTDPKVIRKSDLYAVSGDQAYVAPAFQFIDKWRQGDPSREVYVYVFDNYPDVPAEEGMAGMKHADDLHYTFGTVEEHLRRLNASDAVIAKETELGKNFRKLLTNFVKEGYPAKPNALSDWPTWKDYKYAEFYLAISSEPRLGRHYRKENVTFWNDFIYRLPDYECPQVTGACSACLPLQLTLLVALVISTHVCI